MGLILVSVIVALAAIAVARLYQRALQQARERISNGRTIRTAHGPIEYAEAGHGSPLLLIHGAGGGFDQGLEFAASLVARGFRVIAMSRFGYLGTPLPVNASAEAQADAHDALLEALHIERATVIGASAGAPSAMQLAIRHPKRVAALVLLVPAAYAPHELGRGSLETPGGTGFLFSTALQSDFLYWLASHVAKGFVNRAILATPSRVVAAASPAEQARVARVRDHILPVSARREGLLNDARITSSLPRYDLDRITAPTLTVSAEDDLYGTFAPAKYTAQSVPHGKFLGLKRGGHIWAGHDAEVAGVITEFVRGAAQ
ncbi:MAG TPA: alpha/beta fold hydrolase [Usitatibacter sp.]|nr:alpha/beta fold hydrolase [Usitatibacter sp.]